MLDVEALRSGDRRTLAKTLSAIENGTISTRDVSAAFDSIGNGRVWAITGSPGVGKSCLSEHIIAGWLASGKRVAVLAVDPSSPVSGGALLGDRTRVSSADEGEAVYYRSLATRGNPSAVPSRLGTMVGLLKAAGFDFILIETVGAGQGEISVAAVCDLLLLVEAPGLGDELQLEKAGLIELADAIAVNKCDLAGAKTLRSRLRGALELSDGQAPPVALVSAKNGEGISELLGMLDSAVSSPSRRAAKNRIRLQFEWQRLLLESPLLDSVLESVESGEIDLDSALVMLRGGDAP